MVAALPYVRPTFVEKQRLIAPGGNGWGTLAFVAAMCVPGVAVSVVFATKMSRIELPIVVGVVLLAAAVPLVVICSTMVTVVESGHLRLSMTFGPVRVWHREVPLSTAIGCEVVEPGGRMTARPGWHLMKLPGVAVLKLFGGDTYVMVRRRQPAVVVALGHFKGLVIGSQRPQELADAIQAAMSPIPDNVS